LEKKKKWQTKHEGEGYLAYAAPSAFLRGTALTQSLNKKSNVHQAAKEEASLDVHLTSV